MSDVEASAAPVPDGPTAGQLLRRAREASGLHIATLAVSLKVPVRKLEALEEDRYDQLSDAVFVRALASSVCRTLKVDAQPILERLPQSAKPRLVQTGEGINEPFRAPGDGPSQEWTGQLSRPVVATVVALLAVTLAIFLLPAVRHDEGSPQAVKSAPAPAPSASVPVVATSDAVLPPLASASATVPVAAPAAPSSVAPAPVPSAPAAIVAASAPARPASVAVAAASAPASAAVAPASAASAAAANGIVVFRTRAASWISVTDARGNSVLRKLMEAGETAGATGTLPLSVTVGSAPATDVLVRGKPFDMTPVTHDNVARFEVK